MANAALTSLTDKIVRPASRGDLADFYERSRNLGQTPRQQQLGRLLSYYMCAQYDACAVGWDGRQHASGLEREAIATQGYLPPGFVDVGGQTLPLRFRRPPAPYHLVRVVVERFTSLLFGAKRHPRIEVEGDPATDDYAEALAEAARLWPAMLLARSLGGAMGTVAVGFQFLAGRPVVEVHDPRWLYPEFEDRFTLKLARVTKRFQYEVEEQDAEGRWVAVKYWYRREIDAERDVLFAPAHVGDGREPLWSVAREVEHGLGFCPVVWTQNLPVMDDIDGLPDAHGIYDIVDAIDALVGQAQRGVSANCDPTLVLKTQRQFGEIRKGSDTSITLDPGDTADYLELAGSGPKAAMETAAELRRYALEVAQCVLEHPDTSARTATEIERVYSSMLAKADVLREQYGERCVKPLLEMMLAAARKLGEPRADPAAGALVRQTLDLPPRVAEGGRLAPRRLGPGGRPTLRWSGYFEPGLGDAREAVQAAAGALQAGLVDVAHAARFVAPHFGVENVEGMLRGIETERRRREAEQAATMMPPGAAGAWG